MPPLPREHGAYGQLSFPLLTAFLVAGVTPAAALIALSAVAGFLAHEPLLVLLGRRGSRAQREDGRRARAWLCINAATACAAGLLALWTVAPEARAWLLLPLVPAACVGAAIARQRERGAVAEGAAALSFSLLAVPVCLAAGAPVGTALAVGAAYAAVLVSQTLAVRIVILRVRGGGDPGAARATRIAVFGWTTAIAAALVVGGMHGMMPWVALAAALPGLAAAIYVALWPPPAARLRALGWTLVAAAASTAVILATAAAPRA